MKCTNCDGEGTVWRKAFKQDGVKYPRIQVTCFTCDGTGEMCDHCGESTAVCDGQCQEDE